MGAGSLNPDIGFAAETVRMTLQHGRDKFVGKLFRLLRRASDKLGQVEHGIQFIAVHCDRRIRRETFQQIVQ